MIRTAVSTNPGTSSNPADDSFADRIGHRAAGWGFQYPDTEPCYRLVEVFGENTVTVVKADQQRALDSGYQDHLSKPYEVTHLVATLRRLRADGPASAPALALLEALGDVERARGPNLDPEPPG